MRPKKTKYQVGEIVLHISAGKYGKVLDSWFDGQQWRYEVYHSGWSWSVPHAALKSKQRPRK